MNVLRLAVLTVMPMIFVVGCASSPPPIHEGYATEFTEGEFVRDVRPLKPQDSTDLRELAMTLPILEMPDNPEWYYEKSAPAVTEESWNLPGDGAQAGVRVERLPRSASGAQRIRLTISPLPMGDPLQGFRYVSMLERRDGGWMILEATKTQTI